MTRAVPGLKMREPVARRCRTMAVIAGVCLLLGGCCKQGSEEKPQPEKVASPSTQTATAQVTATAAPTSAVAAPESAVKVGTAVLAPWSRAGKLYPGVVTELYGKLGHVNFNDGDRGWALVSKMRPAGVPLPDPTDTCSFAVGDKVKAPWSRNKAMYSGVIAETHGKLAQVNFLDGDQGWALCAEMQKR